jgi:CheY-like chemotaxis protein
VRKDSPIGCVPPDKTCVLIVEDDSALLGFLFSALVAEGFALVAATDGQQALDLLERGLRPHVILIDLALPRVSGYDLLSYIRDDAALRTIPRIIITGSDKDDSRTVADAVFRKPIDHENLIATIRRLQPLTPPAAN